MRIAKRKALATAAVTSLALALAACGSDSDADSPDDGGDGPDLSGQLVGAMEDYGVGDTFVASEPVNFGLLYRDHPNYPFKEDWLILEQLENEHNVTFDFVNVPLSDWNERRNLLVGAGDAPEIVPATYSGEESQFVAGGALLPVSDYLEYLPNFQDKVEKWGLEAEIEDLRQEDGKFYLLPGLHELTPAQYTIAIRSDLFEAAGITEDPATWDEFADQLEAVKQAHPQLEYGLTDGWDNVDALNSMLSTAAPNFGTMGGVNWGFGDGLWWNGDEFECAGAMDAYRDMIAYFADLVDRGLLDPEAVTQDKDAAISKLLNDQVAAKGTNTQEIEEYRTAFADNGKQGEFRLITVPAGPGGNNLVAGARRESGVMITSKAAESEHLVALLQYVDWQYFSDEGLEFAKWGVEGETFTRESDGTRKLLDDIDWSGINPGAPKLLNADFGFYNGVWTLAHGSTAELYQSMLRPEVAEFVEAMNQKTELPLPPPKRLNEQEREQFALLRATLEGHVEQSSAQFILGQRSLDEWDAYVAELEGMGMSNYVQIANEAASR
jgi:putative aldouronate transport system substrate-binding protein